MRTMFVGRERELALLGSSLDAAAAGQAGVVLVQGEPGIGKSRLVGELSRCAMDQGAVVAWGRADAAGAPPFWPWRQALRDLLEGLGEDPAASGLSTLGSSSERSLLEQRFAQFDEVAQLLRRVSLEQLIVLVLDDLQDADEASLLILRHVARVIRDERLLVIACLRDTGSSTVLAELAVEPAVTRVELRGLSRTDVATQLAVEGVEGPMDVDVQRVYELSGGNPFFVAELARQLDDPIWAWTMPASVRDAIGVRLQRLGPACAPVLAAASVAGPAFAVGLVAAITDRPVEWCLSACDEALRAGVLVAGPTIGEFRFAQALVRDAIEAGVGGVERARLHRRAAEALEGTHSGQHDEVLFDVARHWAVGAATSTAADRAVATRWAERAGRRAMLLHAYEEGARLFGVALQLGTASVDDVARCELLLRLAEAQSVTSDAPEALRTCREAAELAVQIGRPDLAGRATLVVEPVFDPEIDLAIGSLCELANAALGAEQPGLRARVLARYAHVRDHFVDLEEARSASAEAMALAELSSEPAALEGALIGAHIVQSGPADLESRDGFADRMWALGVASGRPSCRLAASEWRFDAASERGDLGAAAQQVEEVTRWGAEIGGPISRWRVLRCRAMLAQARARFDEAYRLGDEALATMAPVGYAPAFMLWSGLVSNLCHHTGITPGLVAASGITDADAGQQDWPLVGIIPTLAPVWILARIGRQREARAIYRRLGPASDWRALPHGALFTWAMGIKVGIALGADEDVATHRSVLGAHRGHHIVNGRYAMAYFGPAELWLGVAAAHLGLFDDAVADLEEAVKACAANGADGFHAEAQYELATALVRRGGSGDRQRARTVLREVTPRLTALGMAPLRVQAEELWTQLDTDASTVLTRREHQVAELVAAGLTNREIASRLFLSERTAQNHVQHILDKLRLPNRSQIAVWVMQMSRSAE